MKGFTCRCGVNNVSKVILGNREKIFSCLLLFFNLKTLFTVQSFTLVFSVIIVSKSCSGSQHSGTAENEREEDSEEENETRCSVCEQPFSDVDK